MSAKHGLPPENEIRRDKYVQAVKEKFEERSQTGIKKYNTTLERKDLNLLDWLNHLQEELMDATLYVERLKGEIKK
jgi:succinate dehydrogenase flavin-adding protein (antitoxin of CptAB toxin-antitoxin module)